MCFSGSAGRREEETDEEAQYYNEHIAPILDRMTVQAKGIHFSNDLCIF